MEMVRPNMTIYWGNRDGNNPLIGLITIQRAKGMFLVVAAIQCSPISVIIHIVKLNFLCVKLWIIAHAMDGITGWFGDVGHVADIYFRKVDGFVHDLWT